MSVTLMIQNELTDDTVVDKFDSIDDVNLFLENLPADESNPLADAPLYIIDDVTGEQFYEVDYLTWEKLNV